MPENNSNLAPTTSKANSKSLQKWSIFSLLAIILVVILGVGGYFGVKSIVETTIETTVEKILAEQADKEREEAGVPESFPTDTNIYPNSEVLESAETSEDVTIRLSTGDSVSKVSEHYEKNLKDTGWSKIEASNFPNSATITAEKEGKQINIFASTDAETSKTTIVISITNT